ncbi:MAG: glycosyltransferase family 2 protein, partial [Gammaproteobacteria bacterium]|nr:glycosyltransferase family 2 protein [Gammaproteobacteria bacterium]
MLHSLGWLTRLTQPKDSARLVMSILCRNEVDIIEANIRTHAKLGVDAFVVMDNGSTDGTRELLESLSREFNLTIIDQPEQTYQQAKWMLQLAHYARDKLGAQWVISNDADEF